MTADETFMRQAIAEAKRAGEEGEIPIGAVIVQDGYVIAKAHNLTEALCDVTAHAEMQAVTMAAAEAGKYLTGCTLYVTVEPCIMCAGALCWSQITRIVYGAKDEKRGASLFSPSPYHPKCEVVGGVLEEECAQLMKSFFRKRR